MATQLSSLKTARLADIRKLLDKEHELAKESLKSAAIATMLEKTTGRSSAIAKDVCIPKPIGCGGPAIEFNNTLSRKEYGISGLCQACQDKFFKAFSV